MAQVDSSSDGNAGVVSPRQPTLISSPIPQTPTPVAGQGRLLEEKNDKISKEKQKFFRLSAFNAEHNKLKRVGSIEKAKVCQNSPKSNRVVEKVEVPKKIVSSRRVPALSSSSSSDASEVSSSEGSESSEDEKEENSSSESSDSTSSEEEEPQRATTLKSKGPFSCGLNEDKPWGFAAAAAKLTVESPFFSNITSTFGAPLPKLDLSDKPTFGLHIQPAASPLGNKKKQKEEKKALEATPPCENKVKPGAGQLKGLFDGLSHFFSAPGSSRARPGAPMPNYAPDRRKRQHEDCNMSKDTLKEKPSKTPKTEISKARDESPSGSSSKEKKRLEEVKELPRVPKPGIFTPSDESLFSNNEKPPKMTPSNLVKTAVNSKRHEHERRKLLKGADSMSVIKCAKDPPQSDAKSEQQTRRKHPTDVNQSRHPDPIKSSQTPNPSNKSNPNPKSNPRACTSATTTNTTTTPRATPCSTRKGKSLPHPFTILTSTMHPFAETPSNLILAHHRGCVGGVVWYGLMCAYACYYRDGHVNSTVK